MTPAEEKIRDQDRIIHRLTEEIEYLTICNNNSIARLRTVASQDKRYKAVVRHFYYMMDRDEKGMLTADRRRFLYLRGLKEVCALHSRDNFSGRVLPE